MSEERESAIHDKAFGEGVKAGWNAASRHTRKSCNTILGKQMLDVHDPDESILRAADNMILEARKILYTKDE